MACFIVPATEAVATTIIKKVIQKKEQNDSGKECSTSTAFPLSKKVAWLNNMLWGGSALLAFEHVWHGEVTPWFPFLTAAKSPDELASMFHEMGTVGVAMAAVVTLVWFIMVGITSKIEAQSKTVQKQIH